MISGKIVPRHGSRQFATMKSALNHGDLRLVVVFFALGVHLRFVSRTDVSLASRCRESDGLIIVWSLMRIVKKHTFCPLLLLS